MSVLEYMGLIFSTKSEKNKIFYRIDPKITLTKVLEDRVKNFKKQIDKIEEKVNIEESIQGVCLKNVPFYHYSDLNLAVNNFFELIENSSQEIILSSLRPIILKKIEFVLYNAYMRGMQIKLYFSNADFDMINNYFNLITDILKRIRIELIQTEQRTCQIIKYNDDIVNMGNIILDENYLNSIVFKEDEIFHVDGFQGPFAKQAKNYLEVLTIIKRIEIEYPEPIKKILNTIRETETIKTRDLSSKSKIGGSKLKDILEFLIDKGLIEEKIIKGEQAGRPKKIYSIIEN
ncbi:MAG: hypothetical protein ACFFCE_03210 [Promethearchaeota archaeon]